LPELMTTQVVLTDMHGSEYCSRGPTKIDRTSESRNHDMIYNITSTAINHGW